MRAPELDLRQIRHDLRNSAHVVELIALMLANSHTDKIDTAITGLREEVETLYRLADKLAVGGSSAGRTDI